MTECLPYIKKRNYGEKQKYYAQNVNPPIVDKDVFYMVQTLLLSRHRDFVRKEYALSGKIYCGKCGATYKRKSQKTVYIGFAENMTLKHRTVKTEVCLKSKYIQRLSDCATSCGTIIKLYSHRYKQFYRI